jgi:hypothetical protein
MVLVKRKSDVGLFLVVALLTMVLLSFFSSFDAFAASDKLTDLFSTRSFRGSGEALEKMDVLGMVLHYVISWFSFLGLCLTLYQKFITLLYLSSRSTFDTIDDIKMNKAKGGPLGIKGLFEVVKTGEGHAGGGFDVFITFVYGLLPNIKAYSDYASEKSRLNSKLEDTDTALQYMLKTGIPTVILVFFLTIGFSGTLGKAYGVIVDGMATAADNVVSRNLSAYVKKMIINGEAYQFTLDVRGTGDAKLADQMAREVYAEILGNTDAANEEFRQVVGKSVEDNVLAQLLGGGPTSFDVPETGSNGATLSNFWPAFSSKAQKNSRAGLYDDANPLVLTDDRSKGVKLQFFKNIDSTPSNPGGEFTFSLSELVKHAYSGDEAAVELTGKRDLYVHVLVQYDPGTNASWVRVDDPANPSSDVGTGGAVGG